MDIVWYILYKDHDEVRMWGYFEMSYLKHNMHMFHTVIECEVSKSRGSNDKKNIPLNTGFEAKQNTKQK